MVVLNGLMQLALTVVYERNTREIQAHRLACSLGSCSMLLVSCVLKISYREECENFSLPPPDFHLAEQVTQDMESCEQMWKLYEEFSAGLQDLSSQDWISFR